MSDWYKGGRDDQRNYGQGGGGREREFGGRDRWSERNGYGTEGRSFDEGGDGYATRYGGARFGDYGSGGGYGDQGWRGGEGGQRDAWRAEQGRGWSPRSEGYGGQGYGREDYGGARAYGNQGYGGSSGSRGSGGSFGAGYGYQGSSGYGGEQGMSQRGYGRTGGSFIGGNEAVRNVTDGDFDRGFGNQYAGRGEQRGGEQRFGEHRGRGPKNYTRSDERIREDVNDKLSDDSWLDASEIDVQVKDGEVTLTGTVKSRDDKRRAEDVAEDCSGVKHVQNNLRVQQQGQQPGAQTTTASTTGSTTTASAAGRTAGNA